MVYLRKARAGSCNLGPAWDQYTWPEDGSVVEVTPGHAAKLLEIPFNDFTVVPEPAEEAEPEDDSTSKDDEDKKLIEEPAPEASISEAPADRKTPAKKAAAPSKSPAASSSKSVKE